MDYRLLSDILRRFAGTLVDDYSLEEVLTELSPSICKILDVHGAGVMMERDDGHLHMISTSDPLLTRLEELQIELDQGPCLLAYRTGEPVRSPDLTTDPRFPAFGSRAAEVGMKAVYSYPLQRRTMTLGALNFYRTSPEELNSQQRDAAAALADVATAYVLHARTDERSAVLNSQLQTALDSRVTIEQAKGFVAGRLDIPVHEAFCLLRDYARSHRTALHDVVHDVVTLRIATSELSTE